MYRARVALPVLLGVIVALWGCTPPQNPTADRSLETRVAKLEKELKAAQEQVTTLTAQVRVEQTRTKEVEKEREDLRAALKLRTDDLAKSQGELDSVRKGLRDLLGKVDAALAPSSGKPSLADVSSLPPIELK